MVCGCGCGRVCVCSRCGCTDVLLVFCQSGFDVPADGSLPEVLPDWLLMDTAAALQETSSVQQPHSATPLGDDDGDSNTPKLEATSARTEQCRSRSGAAPGDPYSRQYVTSRGVVTGDASYRQLMGMRERRPQPAPDTAAGQTAQQRRRARSAGQRQGSTDEGRSGVSTGRVTTGGVTEGVESGAGECDTDPLGCEETEEDELEATVEWLECEDVCGGSADPVRPEERRVKQELMDSGVSRHPPQLAAAAGCGSPSADLWVVCSSPPQLSSPGSDLIGALSETSSLPAGAGADCLENGDLHADVDVEGVDADVAVDSDAAAEEDALLLEQLVDVAGAEAGKGGGCRPSGRPWQTPGEDNKDPYARRFSTGSAARRCRRRGS